jgi:hypothetical protein
VIIMATLPFALTGGVWFTLLGPSREVATIGYRLAGWQPGSA